MRIFSEAVTGLVSPPEAPGSVLADEVGIENVDALGQFTGQSDQLLLGDLGIDERVGALLDGCTVLPGKEVEIVGDILKMTFDQSEWERFGVSEASLDEKAMNFLLGFDGFQEVFFTTCSSVWSNPLRRGSGAGRVNFKNGERKKIKLMRTDSVLATKKELLKYITTD